MGKTITINEVEYSVKPGMKSMILFEKLRDKPFEIKSTTDLLAYIYAAIISGTPDKVLEFDAMLDAFDKDQNLFEEAVKLVLQRNSMEDIVSLANEGGPASKKE